MVGVNQSLVYLHIQKRIINYAKIEKTCQQKKYQSKQEKDAGFPGTV